MIHITQPLQFIHNFAWASARKNVPLALMSRVGCKVIWFGVESGSERMLQLIGRNTTPKQVEAAFKLSEKKGTKVACSFMLGFPGETL